MDEKKTERAVATNRKARYEYHIYDCYEAGIALKGTEVKSIREGNVNLKDSYAAVKSREVFLIKKSVKSSIIKK